MTGSARASVIDLYHQAEEDFFVSISQFYRCFGPELSAYCTGVEASSLNLLMMNNCGVDSAERLAEGLAFIRRHGVPFCVVVPDAQVSQVSELLQQQHLLPSDKTTCMQLDLATYVPRQTPLARVDIRCTDHCLEDWAQPVGSAFASQGSRIAQYLGRHRAALQAGRALRHFTLYVDQQPVSALTLSRGPGVVRLDDIGTVQAWQGRGYATALIHSVLSIAQAQGAQTCVLEASFDGLSIYHKAGFQRLFDYRTFCQP
ncbi:GNAT family N-acetyltransferase [Pseudomonas sp. LD120]|uniref:GNAT family N-acetyltransferase n=1 Tax=Pseudomonas sp. LD120 TaxID=485751 RepID=UPI001357D8ED|nr:GNAT family N-acetyltransferase [Pseudomonas sp. LD120]KAF0863373.1 GNAT family N-acetyltransferase [Pseudomonas sp. LD120]